jgi:putative spermidine/putrescine transport system permease protein
VRLLAVATLAQTATVPAKVMRTRVFPVLGGTLPALPLALFFLAWFIAPFVLLVVISLFDTADFQAVGLRQYAKFLTDGYSLGVLWDTLKLGFLVTAACLPLAYALGLVYVAGGPHRRTFILFLIMLPMLTSAVVRTFAWIVILGREGIINNTMLALGLWGAPAPLLYTWGGLILALAQIQLPLTALPVINSLLKLDRNIVDAAEALGASRFRRLWTVIVPLTMPGAVAGALLVFAASTTAFITQTLVGGGRIVLMPLDIYQQAVGVQDWPFAAALSIVFTLSILAITYLINSAAQRRMRGVDAT